MLLPPLLCVLSGVLLLVADAALVNRTIDDTFGDSATHLTPTYRPELSWQASCQCLLTPDKYQAYNQTWTAATYFPDFSSIQAELQFTGVAVHVFFILAEQETITDFTLDSDLPVRFDRARAPGFKDFEYNALAFSKTGLSNTTHKLTFKTDGLPSSTWVSFDYAVYTFDDGLSGSPSGSGSPPGASGSPTSASTQPKSKSTPVGAIVGGVIGGLAIIGALIAFILFRRRKTQLTTPKPVDLTFETSRNSVQRPPPRTQSTIQTDRSVSPFTATTPTATASSPKMRMISMMSRRSFGTSLYNGGAPPSIQPPSEAGGSSSVLPPIANPLPDVRRQELNARLVLVQQELAALTSEMSGSPQTRGFDAGGLARQIQHQQEQIDILQSQLRASVLLPAEAPPGYQADRRATPREKGAG